MWRDLLAVVAAATAWMLLATVINMGLHLVIPGYREAEATLAFTPLMKTSRLSLAVLCSLIAGAVCRSIATHRGDAAWVTGVTLLGSFLPEHIAIGARLPLWYHMFFLLTLAPFVRLGAAAPIFRRSQLRLSPHASEQGRA